MLPLNIRAALITFRLVGVVKPLLGPRSPRLLQSCPYLLPRLGRLSNHARHTLLGVGLITVLARAYVNQTTSVSNFSRATLLHGNVVANRPLMVAVQVMVWDQCLAIVLYSRFIGQKALGVYLVEACSVSCLKGIDLPESSLTTIPAVSCPEYRKFCMEAFLRIPVNLKAAVVYINIARLEIFWGILDSITYSLLYNTKLVEFDLVSN